MKKTMEKRKLTFLWVLAAVLLETTTLFAALYFCGTPSGDGNYTDEMKLARTFDYEDGGTDDVERVGDYARFL